MNINVEVSATKLGVTTLELFTEANKVFGHVWSQGPVSDMHSRWKKSGTIPMCVSQYIRFKRL